MKNLFNLSQRWCIAPVYFCEEFLLLLLLRLLHLLILLLLLLLLLRLFLFWFFFLLFQIALAHEIKDALQPLKPLGGVHIWINSWSNFRNTEIWTILSCCFFLSDIIVMSSFMFRKMSFYYMDCPPLRAVWMTVFIFFKSVLQHQVGANKAGGRVKDDSNTLLLITIRDRNLARRPTWQQGRHAR